MEGDDASDNGVVDYNILRSAMLDGGCAVSVPCGESTSKPQSFASHLLKPAVHRFLSSTLSSNVLQYIGHHYFISI